MPKEELHEERLLPGSMDDLRGRTPDELRQMLQLLDAHLKSLHQTDEGELRDLDDAEQAAFDGGMEIRAAIVDRLDHHAKIAKVFRRRPAAVQQVMTNLRNGSEDWLTSCHLFVQVHYSFSANREPNTKLATGRFGGGRND